MKNNTRLLRQYIRERLIAEALLTEGILDPGILKAVFLAGGPGSGKSYTAKKIFGGDTDLVLQTFTQVGLKILNSDPAFEMFLDKMGVSGKDLARIADEDIELAYQIGLQPDDPVTGEPMGVPPESPRGKAKKLKGLQKGLWQEGRLGIIYDGTGDNYESIAKKKVQAEALGYDTAMMYINTTLEVAQERNANRDRVLPEELVEEIWTDVQANLGAFQQLFGSRFYIIDNTTYGPPPEAVASALNQFVSEPIQNPIGRAWVEENLALRGEEDVERKAPGTRGRLLGRSIQGESRRHRKS
ncbi:MAG TPA: hypothetical protein EYG51_16840 [Pseudomonadales bacterium]|nr:hypothetical protein [Pseudomonadales bacterium]